MPLKRQQIIATLNQFYTHPVAQVSLELFLSIGAVIFFAIFAIRPTLLTMSDLIKEIDDKKELSLQLSQKIAGLSTAQSEYLTLESRLPVLEEAIPSQPQLLTTLKLIEKIASQQRVIITALSSPEIPLETTADGATLVRQNLILSLTVVGDYPAIRAMVERLQALRRSFIVESILFATNEERGHKTLKATLTLNVPYFGNPAASKNKPKASPKPADAARLGL